MAQPIDDAQVAMFSVPSAQSSPVEMVGLRAEIKLWFDRPFQENPERFLQVYELLLAPIREQLRWYQNFTMSRFAAATPAVLQAPHAWFGPDGGDVPRMLHLIGPGDKMAVGQYALQFESLPDSDLNSDSNTPFLRVVTPARALASNPEGFLSITRQICDHLPFLCGYVGYVLDTSSYFESQAFRAAYPLAMRHPGVHIAGDQATWALRDEKGVETVNWLTLVGQEPLQHLGGAAAVRRALAVAPGSDAIEVVHGLIVRAGPEALIGDVNRGDAVPAYRLIHAALAPVIEPVVRDTRPLLVADDLSDADDMTMRWLRRFAP